MNKETISELFHLLLERQKNVERADNTCDHVRKCQVEKGVCCIACDSYHNRKCATAKIMDAHNQNVAHYNSEIATFIESHGLEFARVLGATRVECAEWLIARNASHHKLTGENNSYYEEFAKEIGVKL